MMLECIVKPAGLRAPPVQRSVVQEDNYSKEISGLFEKYLTQVESKDRDDSYFLAEGMIQQLDLSDQIGIDAFIISHQDEKIVADSKTGLFVSALYNCLDQDVIVYDPDLPIDYLGFRLSRSKSLVVNGTAGNYCGYCSSRLVLVSGTAGNYCGGRSSGLVLVSGSTGKYCGDGSSGLVFVSGTAGDDCGFGSSGIFVEAKEDGVKKLGKYFSGLQITYSALVSNPALNAYIQNLCKNPSSVDVVSAKSEITRLYNKGRASQ